MRFRSICERTIHFERRSCGCFCRLLGKYFLAICTQLFVLGYFGEAHAAVSTNGVAFREFLANPPWIKKFIYGEMGSHHLRVQEKGKPEAGNGIVEYEVSIQPTSFYVKHLSDAFPAVTNLQTTAGLIQGYSSNLFWNLSANQANIMFSHFEKEEQAPTNSVEKTVLKGEEHAMRALNMGIIHLKRGTLEWQDELNFRAMSDWDFGAITGRVLEVKDGVPLTLSYSVEKLPKLRCKAYYYYKENRPFPPNQIVRSVLNDGVERFVDTNWIFELETGMFGSSFRGYTPTLFRTSSVPPKVLLQSNGVSYFIRADGTLQQLAEGPGNAAFGPRETPLAVRAMFIVALFLIVPTLVYFAARLRRRK